MGPRPVTRWAWLTLGPCVTQRGAALSLKMTACLLLSQLLMNLVRKFVFDICKMRGMRSSSGTEHSHYAFKIYANAHVASEQDTLRATAAYNLSLKCQRNSAVRFDRRIISVETGLAAGLCNFNDNLYGGASQSWSQSAAKFQPYQLFNCIHLMFCLEISPSLDGRNQNQQVSGSRWRSGHDRNYSCTT